MDKKIEIMDKKTEITRLQKLRKERAGEYADFSTGPIVHVLQRLTPFLTDKPEKAVSLYVSGWKSDGSYTDGKNITLGMPDQFFDSSYGILDWASVLKTLLAHEAQHINSSSFEELKKIQEDFAAYMVPKGMPERTAMDVAKTMLNILEDGRIENIIVHKLPGYRIPFLLLNAELRRLCGVEKAAETPGGEYCDFHNQILSYAKTGRHMPNARVYKGTRLEKEFRAVQGYIDAAIVAVTAKDCAGLTRKLLWECADYFLELLKSDEARQTASQMTPDDEFTTDEEKEFNPAPSPGEGEEESDEPGDGNASGAGEDSESSKPGKGNKAGKEEGGNKGDSDDQPGEGGKDGKDSKPGEDSKNGRGGKPGNDRGEGKGADSNDGKGSKKPQLPERVLMDRSEDWTDDFSEDGAESYLPMTITKEEMSMLRRGVSDEMKYAEKELKPSASKRPMEDVEKQYAKERDRIFEEKFPKVRKSPLPLEILQPAKRLEKKLKEVLRQKHTEQRGTRRGTLDVRRMYRSRVNDPHVFYRKGKPLKADMAVFELLDNSGSMAGAGAVVDSESGSLLFNKSALSRIAASQIEYALRNLAALKISLFDVACGKIRHATLKQFDEKTDGTRLYNSISDVGIGSGNKDGFSIRVATKELLARRESLKVLLILSDGLPSDYNGGPRADMDDVRNAVKEARRRGILVISILFGDARFRAQSREDYEYMYETFISCDPIEVSTEFQKLFYTLVKKS